MTVTDEIKILDRKIMQNEAQYDLDRKAAKIFALSSNNLDKHEHLAGQEDLGVKPSTVAQAKFEYFTLGKVFAKGLDKDHQKERLFKRLKNIENAKKNLINSKDNDDSIYGKPRLDSVNDKDKDKEKQHNINTVSKTLNVLKGLKALSQEAKDLMIELEDAEDDLDKTNVIGT